MKHHLLSCLIISLVLMSCDSDHTSEYNRIDRYDINGYELFISKYPESRHVVDAKERIDVARELIRQEEERKRLELEELRRLEEQKRLEKLYGTNSLKNGAQPYSRWYGKNLYFDDYTPHSEMRITAPSNSDVIAIVRYKNGNGAVAGHKYIQAGSTVTIYLKNSFEYQTFFYYGKGWWPNKDMKNGLKGGFILGEEFSKDGTPCYMENNVMTYVLTYTEHGNFQTSQSDENEIF